MNKSQQIIAAAAALGKIAEIRQFHLKEDYSGLASIENVQKVNEYINKRTKVDIINDITLSFDDIDRYEEELDEYVKESLIIRIDDSLLSEEMSLLNRTADIKIDLFKTIQFKQDFASKVVKNMFKAIGMTVPSILPIIKSPIRVQHTAGILDEYLSVSKFELRSKTIYVLFHIGTGAFTEEVKKFSFSSLEEQMKKGNFIPGDEAYGATCFFFNESSAYNVEPALLFLKGILKYGKNIGIDFASKKYFNIGTSSTLLLNGNDIIVNGGLVGGDGLTSGHISLRKMGTTYEYSNLYLLNAERMLSDYSKREFL